MRAVHPAVEPGVEFGVPTHGVRPRSRSAPLRVVPLLTRRADEVGTPPASGRSDHSEPARAHRLRRGITRSGELAGAHAVEQSLHGVDDLGHRISQVLAIRRFDVVTGHPGGVEERVEIRELLPDERDGVVRHLVDEVAPSRLPAVEPRVMMGPVKAPGAGDRFEQVGAPDRSFDGDGPGGVDRAAERTRVEDAYFEADTLFRSLLARFRSGVDEVQVARDDTDSTKAERVQHQISRPDWPSTVLTL